MDNDACRQGVVDEYLGLMRRCERYCPPAERNDGRWPGEGPTRCCVQCVLPVEAEALRRFLRDGADGRELLSAASRARSPGQLGECPFLTERDACAIYAVRPLACRMAGLPRHHPYYGRHRMALAEKQGLVMTPELCRQLESELMGLNRRFCAQGRMKRGRRLGVRLADVAREGGLALR
ncbi:MAG: hypothetical protein GF331_14665 [Chitinivibrionales bacterium]|nr:hypothetical protein [Chitinivibrionales bacterium]